MNLLPALPRMAARHSGGVRLRAIMFAIGLMVLHASQARGSSIMYFQSTAGGQEKFSPGLPNQSCTFTGLNSAMPVPTTASATCTLTYSNVAGSTSTLVGQAIAEVDSLNIVRLFASEDWTNFTAPPGFQTLAYTPAGDGATGTAHYVSSPDPIPGNPISVLLNPTPFDVFLSGTMAVSGRFDLDPSTIFDAAFDARVSLAAGANTAGCQIAANSHNGPFATPQSCAFSLLIPAFTLGSLSYDLTASASVNQDSTGFSGTPSTFYADVDLLHTVSLSSLRLTDAQGSILPFSTLQLGTDSTVMLTERGFAPVGSTDPVPTPEPGTITLTLAGLASFAGGRRARRSGRQRAP